MDKAVRSRMLRLWPGFNPSTMFRSLGVAKIYFAVLPGSLDLSKHSLRLKKLGFLWIKSMELS